MFLTAKTTAMVCWLFVGSALFSGVFAILGGQALVEQWVLSLNMTPLQFMILSQAIIFVLGWPLEWTEIIVIFVPIFLPLLKHFNIDPVLWGVLVFVNLQAAFLSPPVAMSAFYLKGVAPKHVTLNQIFAGMMPYMLIVILCMVIMYIWPGMTLWLPNYLYGGRAGLAPLTDARPRRPDRDRCRRGNRARRLSARDYARAWLDRIAAVESPKSVPLRISTASMRWRRRVNATSTRLSGAAHRPAARHSGCDQGHHRHRATIRPSSARRFSPAGGRRMTRPWLRNCGSRAR